MQMRTLCPGQGARLLFKPCVTHFDMVYQPRVSRDRLPWWKRSDTTGAQATALTMEERRPRLIAIWHRSAFPDTARATRGRRPAPDDPTRVLSRA